jgi:hypothetical protein
VILFELTVVSPLILASASCDDRTRWPRTAAHRLDPIDGVRGYDHVGVDTNRIAPRQTADGRRGRPHASCPEVTVWRCLAAVLIVVWLAGCSSTPARTGSAGESQAGLPPSAFPEPTLSPTPTFAQSTGSSGDPTASALPATSCDGGSPIRVDRLNAGGRSCFASQDVRVIGWVAPPWGIGNTSTGVVPSWLGETVTDRVLWLQPRNPAGCISVNDCVWVFVHVRPTGGVAFDLPERWVEVTGHFDDAAAKTCRWDGRTNPPGYPRAQAVDRCRNEFVVTAVRDTSPPDQASSSTVRVVDLGAIAPASNRAVSWTWPNW